MSVAPEPKDQHRQDEHARSCPNCGAPIAPRQMANDARCLSCGQAFADEQSVIEGEEERPKAPWHFKILVFGTLGYLIYRLVWFVAWLTGHAWKG